MELRHLRYFQAVAEELHFARAAARLGISAPTLTQQVQALERDLGVMLLRRSKRSVALTEAGRRFLDEARATLRRAEQATLVARQAARGEIGLIEIGYVTSSSCLGLISTVLADFRRSNPLVDVQLHHMETVRQLSELTDGHIDVGFLRPPIRYPVGITGSVVWRQPFIIAMPADHPLAAGNRIRPASLAGERFVASSVELEIGFGGQIQEIAAEGKFAPKIVGRAPDMLTILTLVASGAGVAFVPESFRKVAIPGVAYRDLAGPPRNASLAFVRRRDDTAPAVKAFVRTLRTTLSREEGTTQNSWSRAGRAGEE
jgi:DNA-binding transcriptional LysR family regulator